MARPVHLRASLRHPFQEAVRIPRRKEGGGGVNLATVAVLLLIILIVGGASYRVYRMIRDHDMCYGCSAKCSECKDGNPINCTFDKK